MEALTSINTVKGLHRLAFLERQYGVVLERATSSAHIPVGRTSQGELQEKGHVEE